MNKYFQRGQEQADSLTMEKRMQGKQEVGVMKKKARNTYHHQQQQKKKQLLKAEV